MADEKGVPNTKWIDEIVSGFDTETPSGEVKIDNAAAKFDVPTPAEPTAKPTVKPRPRVVPTRSGTLNSKAATTTAKPTSTAKMKVQPSKSGTSAAMATSGDFNPEMTVTDTPKSTDVRIFRRPGTQGPKDYRPTFKSKSDAPKSRSVTAAERQAAKITDSKPVVEAPKGKSAFERASEGRASKIKPGDKRRPSDKWGESTSMWDAITGTGKKKSAFDLAGERQASKIKSGPPKGTGSLLREAEKKSAFDLAGERQAAKIKSGKREGGAVKKLAKGGGIDGVAKRGKTKVKHFAKGGSIDGIAKRGHTRARRST